MTVANDAQQLANMARELHRKPLSRANVDAAIKSSTLPAAVANTEPREVLEDDEEEIPAMEAEGGMGDSTASRARHAGRRS